MPTHTHPGRYLAVVSALALVTAPLAAQSASSPTGDDHRWTIRPAFASEEEFDDNVFLLGDAKKSKLGGGAAAGTHYADMVSASDAITTMHAELVLGGAGLGGKHLRITPELEYAYYARNAERRGVRYGVQAEQKTAHGGLLRLKLAAQPQTFFKNYLLDAIDRDLNGSITTDERLYAPARQGETSVDADYTLRLRKASSDHRVAAALRLAGGWYSRSYDAAFADHELNGPTAGTTLLLRTSSRSRLDIGYSFAALAAPRTRIVMLLDETQFDRDFNGNGSTNDVNARAEEMVDRSRTEQELSMAFGTEVGHAAVELEYARRMRRFSSTEPYDVGNNGRRDARNTLGASLRHDLGDAVQLKLALQHDAQSLNRASATVASGDIADYARTRTSLGLEYRF